MGPRADPSAGEARPGAGRRVTAFVALATMAMTIVITLVGLTLHPYVALIAAAALALVAAGVVLFVTRPGATRLLGAVIVASGVVAWIWILVDGDAINFVIALALGTALSTFLALLALRPRPYRPPAREAPAPGKPF